MDSKYAEAVHRDAETVQFTEEEEKAVRHKIDVRVLSLVVLSYVFNQFDRTNMYVSRVTPFSTLTIFFSGNAHTLEQFNDNFGITSNAK